MDNLAESDLSTDNPEWLTEQISTNITDNEIRISSISNNVNHTEFFEILLNRLECIDN